MSKTNNRGPPEQVSTEEVRQHIEDNSLPFLTAELVSDQFQCSDQTARNKLNELSAEGELKAIDLGRGKPILWFRPGFQKAEAIADALSQHLDIGNIDGEEVKAFAKQPYKVLPKAENEYYVVAPRFVPFHVGHLQEQDDAWQVFVVNKYISWIEELPEEINEHITIEEGFENATVQDNILEVSDEEEREQAWEELGGQDGGLYRRVGEDKIQIKSGEEFNVIAELVERGNLPFTAKSVPEDEMRDDPQGVELRSYQELAWDEFKSYGQIGVYWPPGTGKTFLALYSGERVPGKKLVVVPTTTLEQQWEERINDFTENPYEWEVRTYQYLTQSRNNRLEEYQGKDSPVLTVFDECHRLPAKTFSKLATIDTDYRLGLSASPYREDGRTDYIFALTGFPVGINWEELVELGVVDYPTIWLYLYRTERQKQEDAIDLGNTKPGKGVFFSDTLNDGQYLANNLDVPFVSGNTPKSKRMEILRSNRVTVVSRVGDEGMSLPEIDWTIEHQFHGGSRRQELQRTGRVMHGEKDGGQHIIQMTDEQAEKFSDRLYSLEERGMDIQYERRY